MPLPFCLILPYCLRLEPIIPPRHQSHNSCSNCPQICTCIHYSDNILYTQAFFFAARSQSRSPHLQLQPLSSDLRRVTYWSYWTMSLPQEADDTAKTKKSEKRWYKYRCREAGCSAVVDDKKWRRHCETSHKFQSSRHEICTMHVDADILLYSSFQTASRFSWDCEFAMWALNLYILIIETQWYDKIHCPRKPVCVTFQIPIHHDRLKS